VIFHQTPRTRECSGEAACPAQRARQFFTHESCYVGVALAPGSERSYSLACGPGASACGLSPGLSSGGPLGRFSFACCSLGGRMVWLSWAYR
jgi:hypothetical protein